MSPFVIVVGAYLLVALLVAIGVVGFNPAAIRPILRAPKHVVQLLISRRMRQNHALEHATVNIIIDRYRRTSATGMPDPDGFHIRGRVPSQIVSSATQNAARRLRNGERSLAISRRCPTSLVASEVLLAAGGTLGLYLIDQLTPPLFMLVLVLSALISPAASPWLQRLILVDPGIGQLTIRSVEPEEPTGRFAVLSFLVMAPHFVRTGPTGEVDGEVVLITGDQQEIAAGRYRFRDKETSSRTE